MDARAGIVISISLLSAFLVGLLGGVHCLGMCGGIVAALTLGLPESIVNSRRMPVYILAYNTGRLASYTLAGTLMGGVGWLAVNWSQLHSVQIILQALAGLFMVALGLYLGGWWRGLAYLEYAGAGLWRHIEFRARRFMPVSTIPQAFVLGIFWGWLPCGLVYSVLVWSVSAGDPLYGGALMLAFGAGTLPLMMFLGTAAGRVAGWIRSQRARQLAGLLVLVFGLYQLMRLFNG